jgi:hypothetical protein
MGPSTQRKICRDNAGKILLPAGADSDLQRPHAKGNTEVSGGVRIDA